MDKLVERFNALGIGEKTIIIAGVLLFVDGFMPWYGVDLGIFNITRNGWQSPGAIWSILAVLIGLAMATVVILKNLTDVDIPEKVGNFTWSRILLGGGVVALLSLLVKLLNLPDSPEGVSGGPAFGFFLGFIVTAVLAVGGFLMYREEQVS